MTPTLIIANWKMNMLQSDVQPYIGEIDRHLLNTNIEVVIAAPFSLITTLHVHLSSYLHVGAQDVSKHAPGAYTGEISAEQLRDLGVRMTLVGHSERRAYHSETNHDANKKIKRLLALDITPIYCIGESQAERDAGSTLTVLTTQLTEGLASFDTKSYPRIVIAYEPLWAIGTGLVPSSEDIEIIHAHIRSHMGSDARIVYGGSVNTHNIDDIISLRNVDGVLVGGASLRANEFAQIITSAVNKKSVR